MLDELREAAESAVVRHVVCVINAHSHAVMAHAVQLRLRVLVAHWQRVCWSACVCDGKKKECEWVSEWVRGVCVCICVWENGPRERRSEHVESIIRENAYFRECVWLCVCVCMYVCVCVWKTHQSSGGWCTNRAPLRAIWASARHRAGRIRTTRCTQAHILDSNRCQLSLIHNSLCLSLWWISRFKLLVRILAIFLSLYLSVSVLCGCSSHNAQCTRTEYAVRVHAQVQGEYLHCAHSHFSRPTKLLSRATKTAKL